jgi:HPt (histidine-containing phosphotransfer) domain-containing protein
MSVLDRAPVVFDARAVRNLTGHANDRAFARVLVGRYRQLLPLRVRRIGAAVRTEDLDDAMDAVLSLKAASSTLGAGELYEIAVRIEGHLRRQDFGAAVVAASELPGAEHRAERALTAFLGG